MKIAISTPTTWPYVRRGGERFANELARFLGRRGHEVTIISSKPGPRERRQDDGYVTDMHRRWWHPQLAKIGFLEAYSFMLSSFPQFLTTRYDIIHCCTFLDTFAATLAKKVTGTPCIYWVNSVRSPVRYHRALTLGGGIYRRAVRDVDEIVVLSRYMRDAFYGSYGRQGLQIPVPVDIDCFRLAERRNPARQVILCAAALEDPRKGGGLLMRAFDRLKQTRSKAVLQIASRVAESTQRRFLEMVSPQYRRDVQFLGAGEVAQVPRLFAEANISVLPSRWESFGMVVLESMAAGTPVVGTREAAIPELISNNTVGTLFDPGPDNTAEPTNLEGLVLALDRCLQLSVLPETARNCRAHAEQFSWERIGPRFEEVYKRIASGTPSALAREANS